MKLNTDWLRFAGSLALLSWIIGVLDWQEMIRQFSGISLPLFMLALVVNALSTVMARAMLVWSLIAKTTRPPLLRVMEVFFSLRFFSIALPKPVVVGLRIKRLGNLFGKDMYFAMGIMSYEALTGGLVMALGAVIFLILQANTIEASPAGLYVSLAAVFLLGLFLLLFTKKIDFLIHRIIQIPAVSPALRDSLKSRLHSWREWVTQNIARDRNAMAATFGFALIFYLGFITSGYVLFLAMGGNLDFSEIAWARSAVWLITVLPISIGGLGVREAGLAYLLADFGVEFELAVAYGFLSFILQTAIGLLGAVVELKNAALSR
jgi:uncharacterized protein (TIRG00374 family)